MKRPTLSYLVSIACSLLLFGIFPYANAAPALPNINTNNIITITNAPYNALGDGATDNTLAISNAIVQAAKGGNTNNLFGGIVRVPAPGVFLSGPLTFANNIDLQVDTNATLKMLPVNLFTSYPPQSGNGLTYGDLIYASGVTNLEISGFGTIDGQGLMWWTNGNSTVVNNRPYMIYFNGCKQVLIQNVTVQNPPKMHIVFKSVDNNITIQGININTTNSLANQCDGIDLVGTNCLVQNCIINSGDDNIALGSSSASAISVNILVTNCAFGTGHGMSIGSNTAGAVSNLTVINCTFNGTQYGIRMKSSINTSGGSGEGGIAQNLSYLNLGMTNIIEGAVVIYSYYDSSAGGQFGTPTGVTPFFASTQAVTSATIPIWRNITISNVNATVGSSGIAGIIWGRTETPATNIVFNRVNITAPKSFDVYNAQYIQFLDSKITPTTGGQKTFEMWNAGIVVSNSLSATNLVTFDGLAGDTNASLALYNAPGSMISSDLFGSSPVTLSGSVLTNTGNLTLTGTDVENFALGTNSSQFVVNGGLVLNSKLNITNSSGFTATNYVLFTYTGTLAGTLVLGNTPTVNGYSYRLDTNTAGQVKLVVSTPSAPSFGKITVMAGSGGGSFVLSGNGGVTNGTYLVLTSTNLALPVNQWTSIATNPFDASGNFIFTNTPVPSAPQLFYMLEVP